LSSATSCRLDAVYIMSSSLVATAFEEHDACASGWRYDTSPPNGMLLVNVTYARVYGCQRSGNQ
ncbi:hypothetical protein, partial [Terracidiphilus sp.]|uniref:hypothetical protein n=1 Tax=Terracidiphilus sp. TaxID=1964191 RepID=UPI003C1FE2E1